MIENIKLVELLGKKVVVTPDAVSDVYDTAIELHKTDQTKAAEKPSTGYVDYASPECGFVKTGDRILFNQWAGLEVELEYIQQPAGEKSKRKKFLVLTEPEVMIVTERTK